MTAPGSLKLLAIVGGLVGALVCGLAGAAAGQSDSLTTASVKAGQFPTATDVRLGGDEKQTRFVMDFDRKVDLATFTLADPYRVVIDLPQVAFKLPPKTGDRGRGLVKAFRFGLIMQGGSRIVIDTAGPVRVDKAFALAPGEGQPARLVLDLVTTDRDSFMHDMALGTHVAHNTSAPKVSASREVPSDPRPLIVIDPGHGGIDTGTKSGNGHDEKDVVLAFGLLLRDKLEKTGKYRVIMTRSDDTFIPLWDRVRFARAHKASLFISVHADSIPKSEGQAEGATVYTLSDRASDAQAERLADAENKSDVIAGVDLTSQPDDVANILIDLAQRETKMFSSQFARTLVGELKGTARLHQHPLKSAGFIVLKAPDVPSVLVELGYMSTQDDLVNLVSKAWRSRTADSLVSAVNTFFAPRLAGAGPAPGPD
ncbi:MAG: N-acetylmuramoyl-L-alanine amidase [Pseudolabrys sp.]